MCVPIVIAAAALAISAASTYASYSQQQGEASAQSQMAANNKTNALYANRLDQQQLTQQAVQVGNQKSAQDIQGNINLYQAIGATNTSAAQGGIAGVSVDNLVAGLTAKNAWNQNVRQQNYDNTIAQISADRQSAGLQTESQINAVQPGTQPSGADLGLGLAGDAFGAYQIGSKAANGGPWFGNSPSGGYGASNLMDDDGMALQTNNGFAVGSV